MNSSISPSSAESILISSCRVVGERLAVPMPSPRVELRLGEGKDAVESEEAAHVIQCDIGTGLSLSALRLWSVCGKRNSILCLSCSIRCATTELGPAHLADNPCCS
jgi:hypothetical protein